MEFNAKQIAKEIKANVKAHCSGKIDRDTFSAKQRVLWDSVAQGETNIIGSDCDARHMAVQKYLNV